MVQVIPISAFSDNYIWALINHDANSVYVVDPGDAEPVLQFCHENALTLRGILVTHHHWDHTNGIEKLVNHFENIPVYGPTNSPFEGITQQVTEGETIHLEPLNLSLNVMEVPGHTLDHIAYFNDEMIFCGDTLFNAGCGRLFEGTAQQMLTSLTQIAALPDKTKVYCTHEYTRANLEFAAYIEPENSTLMAYKATLAENTKCSLPSTIEQQKAINPFLRTHISSVQANICKLANINENQQATIFKALRELKDNY